MAAWRSVAASLKFISRSTACPTARKERSAREARARAVSAVPVLAFMRATCRTKATVKVKRPQPRAAAAPGNQGLSATANPCRHDIRIPPGPLPSTTTVMDWRQEWWRAKTKAPLDFCLLCKGLIMSSRAADGSGDTARVTFNVLPRRSGFRAAELGLLTRSVERRSKQC